MSFFLFLLLLSITFSQSIQHEQIISLKSNESINLSIFIDDADREIYSASLMYKNINQTEYLVEEMILTGNNVFSATITDHFTDKLDIEYLDYFSYTNYA